MDMVSVHPLGLFLLVAGLIGVFWPYTVAKLGEQWDSIGSKRSWYSVEPADWNVTLTRVIGAVLAVFGAFVILINL